MSTIEQATNPPAATRPERIGQGTAIEQSRAIAEVQAMVVVAQQLPRVMDECLRQMRESCSQKALADLAFFRYDRAGSQISGPTVQLARELARCFGNITYGISELRRDDEYHQSEMQAWAWDVQTNARSSNTFIVPHKRDKRGSAPQVLTETRDIYENNANMGARRLREAIFSVLPAWFVEEAKDVCLNTSAHPPGDKRTFAQRLADAIKKFGDKGISKDQLETKLGRSSANWTPADLATLTVVYRSIERGEATLDDEFEPQRVTLAELTDKHKPDAPEVDRETGELSQATLGDGDAK